MLFLKLLRMTIALAITFIVYLGMILVFVFVVFASMGSNVDPELPSPKTVYLGIRDGITSACRKTFSFFKNELFTK